MTTSCCFPWEMIFSAGRLSRNHADGRLRSKLPVVRWIGCAIGQLETSGSDVKIPRNQSSVGWRNLGVGVLSSRFHSSTRWSNDRPYAIIIAPSSGSLQGRRVGATRSTNRRGVVDVLWGGNADGIDLHLGSGSQTRSGDGERGAIARRVPVTGLSGSDRL